MGKAKAASLDRLDEATLEATFLQGEAAEAPKISMLGQSLSLIRSPELPAEAGAQFVRTSDIFHKFFSKRHWDEFKTILEKNGVQPLVIAEAARKYVPSANQSLLISMGTSS